MTAQKRIKTAFKKTKINKRIPLYKGPGYLKQCDNYERVNCTICLKWFPNTGLYISSKINKNYNLGDAGLKIEDREYQINLVRLKINSKKENYLESVVTSDTYELVANKKIHFALVNFKNYVGIPVFNDKKMQSWSRDRITVVVDDYSLIVEKRIDFNDIQEDLKNSGGYGITHYGVVDIKNKNIKPDEIISALQFALSFINGAWCGPVLLAQWINRRKLVKYRNCFLSEYKYRRSVLGKMQYAEMQEIILLMCCKLLDERSRQAYMTLVHTYIVCSDVSKITVEMATVLIQSALEMIAEMVIYEKLRRFSKKEWNAKPASTKIEILLKEFKITSKVPSTMRDLHRHSSGKKLSGPVLITKIRNPQIHPDKKNRVKIAAYTADIRIQIWRLAMWYYDLCVLKLIDYNGEYNVTISSNKFEYSEFVPWAL